MLHSISQQRERLRIEAVRAPAQTFGEAPGAAVHDFLAPLSVPFRLPTAMYGAMLAIWHLRPILQRRFPLHKGESRDFLRFLAWCAVDGRRQYALLRSIPDWDADLARPIALPAIKGDCWAGGFSVAMFLLGVAKFGYSFGAMLDSAAARHRVASTYWRGERLKRHLPPPAQWQCNYLARRFKTADALVNTIRHRKNDAGKSHRELIEEYGLAELQNAFKAPTAPDGILAGPADSQRITLLGRIRRSPIGLPVEIVRPVSWLMEQLSPRPSESQLAGITCRIPATQRPLPHCEYPFGVNLFGYARGELGIGEDVRLLALALEAQGIPFCIVNVQPGADVSQRDSSAEQWIVDAPRYAINIFCVTGIEQVRYALENGLDAFHKRYTIGFWPWELPSWPASCNHAFSLVDEIWGISRYTANAYRHARLPVLAMPQAVSIDSVAPLNRADFGLPDDDYLFVFSFDLNSTLSRKNPAGVIRAFQRAFPTSRGEAVGLVLKASHVKENNKQWARLRALVDADPRIHLIDRTLRRPEVLALYRCCDCYVSLHRAEGFGRGLAEALLLDMQLIATGFSGNLDFCTEDRVGLVRYEKRDLKPNEYFHAEGQYWAEPDIAHAAQLMREIRANPLDVHAGEFDFSPAGAGARYAQRLHEIRTKLNLSRAKQC